MNHGLHLTNIPLSNGLIEIERAHEHAVHVEDLAQNEGGSKAEAVLRRIDFRPAETAY